MTDEQTIYGDERTAALYDLLNQMYEDSHEMLNGAVALLVTVSINHMADSAEGCLEELVANVQMDHREAVQAMKASVQ